MKEKAIMLLYLLVTLLVLRSAADADADPGALPECQGSCGNVTVPYPFGLVAGCYSPGFRLTCNESYDPPKLFIGTGNIEVLSVNPDSVIIAAWMARDCYDEPDSPTHAWTDLRKTVYTFSYALNRFTVVGCDAVSLVSGGNSTEFVTGCVALCRDDRSVEDGSCGGIGCCQTSIPKGVKRFDTLLRNLYNHNRTSSFDPCNYAFLIDDREFEFSVSQFANLRSVNKVPAVLDWAVGNLTCAAATRSGEIICTTNSYCSDSTNGPGYQCTCKKGYQGNPYLPKGCQDVNECEDPNNNPCVDICTNTIGSYVCSCSQGSTGDGRRDGSGCTSSNSKSFPLIQVVLGCGLGFLFVLMTPSLLYWGLKKRRLTQQRVKFFKQNGGLLLQQQITSHEGAADIFKIFTPGELSAATNNYSPASVIGRGGNGTVYRGTLPDRRVVAIKKSMLVDETQVEQFVNEVAILSRVIHRNVVKILGCCLETPVPLLVYEFVPNGTLADHLRGRRSASLSWEARLRVACETAAALAYLHSATSRPVIHRDVKSTNILLDQRYAAKVADFGASVLMPLGQAHLTTMVQGTLGYLDPEYFQTGLLTEKSDVYSFGVVLVELLTGEKPISSERSEEERSLAMYFILSRERNQVFEILEPRVASEGVREQLEDVVELAERCLRLTGDERPTMKEVSEELERAKGFQRHPWIQESEEEMSVLLGESTISEDQYRTADYGAE